MSTKRPWWCRLARSLWRHSLGPLFCSNKSSVDDHQRDTDANHTVLQRNCTERESEQPAIPRMANSDPVDDSFTRERDLSPFTPKMMKALYSDDARIQLDATKRFAKLLETSEGLNLPIDELIRSGAVPRFVHFLEATTCHELQFEAVCILANIARGSSAQAQVVIDSGAVPVLIKLLTSSSNENVVEYSVWALGNIARASRECRDLLLNSHVLPSLLGLFNNDILSTSFTATRTATCTLRSLCWGQNPRPNFEQVSPCLPVLSRLINSQECEILSEACLALASLSVGPNDQIQAVIESGVCPRAVQLLSHTSTDVVEAALDLVCNIATGNDSQAQILINANALPALGSLLSHEMEPIVELACCTLANITAGNESQIQAVIDANLTRPLIELLQYRDINIRKQVVRALGNIACASTESRDFLLNSNMLPSLLGLFNDDNDYLVMMRLMTLTLRYLCDKKPFPNFKQISQCLPLLARLMDREDEEILENVCLALSGLSDGPNEQIQAIINSGVCPRAVQLLSHTSNEVVFGALVLVSKIAMGTDSQAQILINANAYPALGRLLSHENTSIVKEAGDTLSNITARQEKPIQAVIEPNIASLIGRLHHGDISVRKRALKALANAIASGSEEQIMGIVEAGVIAPLCKLLSETGSGLTEDAVSGLFNILRTGEIFAKTSGSTVNPFATLICNAPSMKLALYSEDTAIQLGATKRFGKLLGTPEGKNLLIDELIRSDIVQRFVHFLKNPRNLKLQFESAWVITDLSVGNSARTQVVIDAGAVPALIKLLTTFPNENVVKLCVRALGNIAAPSTESRDLVLNSNVLPPLLGLFNNETLSTSTVRTATRTLRNVCDKSPPPNFEQASQCLPLLAHLMVNEDEQILENVCLALSCLSDGPVEQIQAVIDSGVCPRAVQLLSHTSNEVVSGALVLVGKIAMGTDLQAQILIKANALPALDRLLSHEKASIIKEAGDTLSNITARNEKQIQSVIEPNISSLIERLHHRNIKVRKSAVRALANAIASASEEQIVAIVEAGAIPPLCRLLSGTGSDLIERALNCLVNILISGEGFSTDNICTYATLVVQCGSCPRVVQLLSHTAVEVVNEALDLVCNIVYDHTGTHNQVLIDANALPALGSLLSHLMECIVRTTCQTLTNITNSGTEHQIQSVIDANLIPSLIELLQHEDFEIRQSAAKAITKATANGSDKQIVYIVEAGAISPFCQLLSEMDSETILVALIFLESILRTDAQTQAVIDAGTVPVLIKLLTTSSNENVLEHSVSVLGKIAFDSTESRDILLNSNVLPPLLGLFNDNASLSMMQMATQILRGLCKGQNPPPNFEQVSPCIPVLSRLINSQDDEILSEACLALSSLGRGSNEQIQVVIDSGVCPRAIQLLSHTSNEVVEAALGLVCNIVSGDDVSPIQALINANALPALGSLLSHEMELIVDNACCTLANISSGTEQHIQAIIDTNLIPSLIELLHQGDIDICQEIARAIRNVAFTGTDEQVVYFVEAGAIAPLCKLLSETDSDLLEETLSGIENILCAGEEISNSDGSTENAYATLVKQCGGFDKIAFLSSHDNLEIAQKASTIIEMYFGLQVKGSSEKDSLHIDSRDEFPSLS